MSWEHSSLSDFIYVRGNVPPDTESGELPKDSLSQQPTPPSKVPAEAAPASMGSPPSPSSPASQRTAPD